MAPVYKDYLYSTYSGWLGKIIGIRMGAPVEGWDREKILQEYPDLSDYLCDYGIFAADDDSNGPMFFVRALQDNSSLTPEDVGDAFLSYIQEYKGFFWWGGVGVSSEHTAYENLKNGIRAPRSGSIEQNGLTIAEQIGGQIFSDCWGFVSLADPLKAKAYAVAASSVTHDRNGIQGGIFVAVAIALAYRIKDIHQLLDETFSYLDKDLEYYQVGKDVISFYQEHPDSPLDCIDYIREHYGYDKYPGVCHIIPNMAAMILCLCYGDNDFDATMELLLSCGWDTDCNLGNVGSILGTMLGIDKISPRWIMPIRDILNASSCIGCLNITEVSSIAKLFVQIAYSTQGIDIPDNDHFDLPYAYEGFFGDCKVENHGLSFSDEIYKYVYYMGSDIYDARYDPSFSPVLYPGDSVFFKTEGDVSFFVEDCFGNRYIFDEPCFKIPRGENITLHKIGLIGRGPCRLLSYRFEHHHEFDIDFSSYHTDTYGPRYEGDDLINLRSFVFHSGEFSLDNGLLINSKEHALASTGHLENHAGGLELTVTPLDCSDFFMAFSMRDYLHYYKFGLNKSGYYLIKKDKEEFILLQDKFDWKNREKIKLKLSCLNGKITLYVNETCVGISDYDHDSLIGLTGFGTDDPGSCIIHGLKLH